MAQTIITGEYLWLDVNDAINTLANLKGLATGDAKYQIIQKSGADVSPAQKKLNFSGSYWNIYNDTGNNRTIISVNTLPLPGNLVAYDTNGAISASSNNIAGYSAYFTQNNGFALVAENASQDYPAGNFYNQIGEAVWAYSDADTNVVYVKGDFGKFAKFDSFHMVSGTYHTIFNFKTSGYFPAIYFSEHSSPYSGVLTHESLTANRHWKLPNTGGSLLTDQVSRTEYVYIPCERIVPRTTSGPGTTTSELSSNKVMVKGYDFDPTGVEYAQFVHPMPANWNRNAGISGAFEWTHTGNFGTGLNVQFGFRASLIGDGQNMDIAFSNPTFVTDSGGTAGYRYLTTGFSAITPNSSTGSFQNGFLIGEIFRSGFSVVNNLSIDAKLLGFRLYYQTTGYSN